MLNAKILFRRVFNGTGPMARKPGTGRLLVLGAGIVTMMASAPVYAYLDPGTGSIILQSVLAGIAVAIRFLRLYWYKFKSFLSSLTGGTPDAGNRADQGAKPQVDSGDQH